MRSPLLTSADFFLLVQVACKFLPEELQATKGQWLKVSEERKRPDALVSATIQNHSRGSVQQAPPVISTRISFLQISMRVYLKAHA